MAYLTGHSTTGCVFCQKIAECDDDANLVVIRREFCFITMNLYPYNNGHLMVVPYRHVASLEDLRPEELLEVMSTVNLALAGLRNSMSPGGFNIGVNLGKAAGAGIDTHVHVHVVPRWAGDTNFMPVVADVRVVPESLVDTCRKLRRAIQSIAADGQGEG
ncbi:MAG: HIT family protein [Anaerolineae bacterium]